jgi:hypothetical protein
MSGGIDGHEPDDTCRAKRGIWRIRAVPGCGSSVGLEARATDELRSLMVVLGVILLCGLVWLLPGAVLAREEA